MFGRYEPFEVFRDQPCALGGPTNFNSQFPVGKPWHSLDLYFTAAVVIGTGTTPYNENFLKLIRGISFWSPKNDYFFQNVPGRLAYQITLDAFERGAVPLDQIAQATASYKCLIRIPFADKAVFKPSEFLLDTLGFSNMNLSINLGTIAADVFSSAGTSTVAVTCTAVLNQEPVPLVYQNPRADKDKMEKEAISQYYLSYFVAGFGDPTTMGQIDLPRAADIAYYKLWAFHGEPVVTGGQSFSGITDNIGARYTDFTLRTDSSIPLQGIKADYLRDMAQSRFGAFDSALQPNSYWQLDFPANGQKQGCLYSGDKSMLRLNWTLPGSGAASAASMLSIGAKAWRKRAA